MNLRCPHGRDITARIHHGLRRYVHEDGTGCALLNGLHTTSELIAAAQLERFATNPVADDHELRCAYASYRASTAVRLAYLTRICALGSAGFEAGFAPIDLALREPEVPAWTPLLIELYYAFAGIDARITQLNDEVTASPLFALLTRRGCARVLPYEDATTRDIARALREAHPAMRGALRIPA